MSPGPVRRPPGMPPIKGWMTPFPYSIDAEQPLVRAREMMREHDIRHLPVKRDESLVGVISAHRIEAVRPAAGGERPPTVGEVAVDAFVVDLSTPADRVLLEMAKRHADSALVTRQGNLVGIFTVTDACRVFGQYLRAR